MRGLWWTRGLRRVCGLRWMVDVWIVVSYPAQGFLCKKMGSTDNHSMPNNPCNNPCHLICILAITTIHSCHDISTTTRQNSRFRVHLDPCNELCRKVYRLEVIAICTQEDGATEIKRLKQ